MNREARTNRTHLSLGFVCFVFVTVGLKLWASVASAQALTIHVSISRAKAERGQTVNVTLTVQNDSSPSNEPIRAVLLKPTVGTEDLSLQPMSDQAGIYRSEIALADNAPAGLYVIHAWTGEMASPTAVGKATFRLGNIVGDFFIASYLDPQQPAKDLERYLQDFRQLGGNLLIAHNLITPAKAFYASSICKTDVIRGSPNDLVELALSRADRAGYSVLLSVSWDITWQSHFKDRMKEIKAILAEMYALYRHHPSLAGFYSYQEGSGTYYAAYVREFSEYVKSLHSNLLTACAPHIDDPLLAGYLSAIESLDIIIYQGAVMASYRTDNRKKYPLRRVKDFCSLGAGAKRLQSKIALTHIEVFAYLEKRQSEDFDTASYQDIYQQILSAATVTDTDGITLFTYHAHIYEPLKRFRQVQRNRAAVADGLKAYELITARISHQPNPLAFYVPYSDWVIERWPNSFLPALDAFRAIGIPIDVLPFAPPLNESIYPYYPFHMNEDVLARLLKERTVLVLPNVSGFQQTDSDLIKAFVAQGGVIIAFGPQIPMGRSYERRELFGGEEANSKARASVMVKEAVGRRVSAGTRFTLGAIPLPSWTSAGARVVAAFEDGSAAILTNKYGKGTIVTILPDAWTAAQRLPELVRDMIDYALTSAGVAPVVDIVGTNENVDVTVGTTSEGFCVAIVNYNDVDLEVVLKPINSNANRAPQWIDLPSRKMIQELTADRTLRLRVPAKEFRSVELHADPTFR